MERPRHGKDSLAQDSSFERTGKMKALILSASLSLFEISSSLAISP